MSVFPSVETFLRTFCVSSSPLLLALSGGPDSLCLFYCLLTYRQYYGVNFHIAHVDHGWRQESQAEAQALQQLAFEHQVPFHLKTLDPTLLKGNLEAACREERYAFFASLCQQFGLQGVLTGHHQDDQAETIFKRILEGAHWSRWKGLQPEKWIHGVRILRPLLGVSKEDIRHMVAQQNIQAFEDPTNQNQQFLRARLRETIFPRLNQEFGKKVEKNFIEIGEEVQDLVNYFESRLLPLLDNTLQGPWGICLDLQSSLPSSLLEIKYLIRLLCTQQGFFLSRLILEQAAQALQSNKAHQLFAMGSQQIRIDRRRIFILQSQLLNPTHSFPEIQAGTYFLGNWKIDLVEAVYAPQHLKTSWKEGWQGHLKSYLPFGSYTIGFLQQLKSQSLHVLMVKKRWSQAKVPLFLSTYFPLIWTETGVSQEFLVGQSFSSLKEGTSCWKIELTWVSRQNNNKNFKKEKS